jgi:hypothetical protein
MFLIFISSVCTAQINSSITVIGTYDGIGIIKDNKFQKYELDNYIRWIRDSSEFSLPDGFKKIFYYDGVFGVIVNDIVTFYKDDYEKNKSVWEWKRIIGFEFPLPKGYSDAFTFQNSNNGIWVVVNNEIRYYYPNDNDIFELIPEFNFTPPVGYKYVFGTMIEIDGEVGVLGFVFNNQIVFYQWHEGYKQWVQDNNITFNLPSGSNYVFGTDNEIGVVFTNRVEFYEFKNNIWLRRTERNYVLN